MPVKGLANNKKRKVKIMQNVDFIQRLRPLGLALAVTTISLGLAACGGSSSSSKNNNDPVNPEDKKAINCEASETSGKRVICIGEGTDLSDKAVQEQLINSLARAQSGDTFVLPQGKYYFNKTIGHNNSKVSGLTLKGAGMDKTIIDTSGASQDGFFFENTDNLIFEDFGIYESNNNALKIANSDGIIIRRMATVWETDFQATNGAYGLYPVQTSNVLIEDSFVQGSADAGIYVGQSDKIVVRNNIAVKNVAGIEIENSTEADVYGNEATGNTGGILIFDLPIGNGKYGSGVRVFDNLVKENNAPNFANKSAFSGGVHIVPPGTGVIVLSTSDVEIYNNTIKDHQTTSIAVTSYMLADDKVAAEPKQDVGKSVLQYGDIHPYATMYMDGWSPLVRNINIHDNKISVADGVNNPKGELIKDIIFGYGVFHLMNPDLANGKATIPHILYDGVGELLANTPHPDPDLDGASLLQAIAGGINQVAAGIKDNIPGAKDFNEIDLTKFASYSADGGVCQSNNGVDGSTIFAASVFETTLTANNFDFAKGEPFSKLEQILEKEVEGLGSDIMGDAAGVMTCSSTGFKGSAATVTFNETKYGCDADDKDNASCKL